MSRVLSAEEEDKLKNIGSRLKGLGKEKGLNLPDSKSI